MHQHSLFSLCGHAVPAKPKAKPTKEEMKATKNWYRELSKATVELIGAFRNADAGGDLELSHEAWGQIMEYEQGNAPAMPEDLHIYDQYALEHLRELLGRLTPA